MASLIGRLLRQEKFNKEFKEVAKRCRWNWLRRYTKKKRDNAREVIRKGGA